MEYRAVSGVPPPSPPSECALPPHQRRGLHTRRGWGGGSIFWKTPDIGLASYSIISLRGCRTGPTGYTAWRNWFLGIDSWAPKKCKNSGSNLLANCRVSFRELSWTVQIALTGRNCTKVHQLFPQKGLHNNK